MSLFTTSGQKCSGEQIQVTFFSTPARFLSRPQSDIRMYILATSVSFTSSLFHTLSDRTSHSHGSHQLSDIGMYMLATSLLARSSPSMTERGKSGRTSSGTKLCQGYDALKSRTARDGLRSQSEIQCNENFKLIIVANAKHENPKWVRQPRYLSPIL